jgi:hypothetical protein
MPNRIDHGLLVVHDEGDGTTSLSICARVIQGEPVNVFARYPHAQRVEIAPDVELIQHGNSRHTKEIVEVDGRSGVVSVRYPR